MRSERSALRIQRKATVFALGSMLALLGGYSTIAVAAEDPRPQSWATPIAAIAGLPNLHRVNSLLYRSAQPLKEGFLFLERQLSVSNADRPIKTVLSLRAFHDNAPLIPESSALRLEQIRFKSWHPEDEDVVKFLRIATTPALQPVLVHCEHGADRTGTMVAIYRIVFEGWTKAQATDEMVNGGFGFHPMWKNLIRYIEKLDVSAIKAQVAAQGDWQ